MRSATQASRWGRHADSPCRGKREKTRWARIFGWPAVEIRHNIWACSSLRAARVSPKTKACRRLELPPIPIGYGSRPSGSANGVAWHVVSMDAKGVADVHAHHIHVLGVPPARCGERARAGPRKSLA